MAKSYCVNFPNCSSLARRFNVNQGVLNAYINTYNMFLPSGEERISSTEKYTEEKLDEIYNKISAQLAEKKKDPEYIAQQRAAAEKVLGGPEALAFMQASEVFSGKEIEEITSEIARLIITRAEQYATENGKTVEEVLTKGGSKGFLGLVNYVKNAYSFVFNEANGIINGAAPRTDGRIKSLEEATKVRAALLKIFMPTQVGGNRLNSMIVLSLPVLNRALGIRLHANFTVDKSASFTYELAESLRDVEEPQQDRWQQALDAQTLEDTLSSIIARVIMQLPRTRTVVTTRTVDDGAGNIIEVPESHSEIVTSPILKLPMFSNIGYMAKQLSSMLVNITSEGDILKVLSRFSEDEQFGMLYQKLLNDPRLLTTFFQDFNKYRQTYRAASLSNKTDGTIEVSVAPLNKGSRNEGVDSYLSRLKLGRVSPNSVFETVESENGFKSVNLKSYKMFYQMYERFKALFLDSEGTFDNSVFKKSSLGVQEGQITSILEALNFPIDIDVVREILSDVSKQDALISALNSYFTFADGIFGKSTTGVRKSLSSNEDIKSSIGSIMNLLQSTPKSKGNRPVTFAGNRLSSLILNSPYSILTKKLNSLYDTTVEGKEFNAFSNYLEAKFLNSEQYRDSNGTIFSRWLRDLYECRSLDSSVPSMKSIFGISRDLGIDDTKFEEINDKQHMLMFVMGYLGGRTWLNANVKFITEEGQADKNDRSNRQVLLGSSKMFYRGQWVYRDDPAYIPSFITGDTNALRQISTIHYYLPEILSGMYDLYQADKANQDTISFFNERGIVFSANGKEAYTSRQTVNENGKKVRRSNADKFGILQFLNETHKGNETWHDYFQSQGGTQEAFERITREYLNEKFQEFKSQLEKLGLLEKTEDGKYVYFNSFLGNNESAKEQRLEELLFDFYTNYKFGAYNQAHLMQVNPLFLNGVEDHQKRNKGTLTTGSVLSMEAKDADGNYIWEYNPITNTYNFNSRVLYFKDVKAGLDRKSYEALKKYFTRLWGESKAEKYIEDNFSQNSLTDGQAYRSFESYRKVLMSAGLSFWSENQERAYQKIMDMVTPIREARRNGKIISLTSSQIQEIEDSMAEMQPIKPINDGIETFGDTNIKVAFQFKYAEVPLLPELFPVGSKLRELGDMMVDRGVDLLASDKCLKKGSFGEIDLQYRMVNGRYVDKDGNILPGMNANGEIITDGSQTAGEQRANPENKNKFVEYEDGTSVRDIFDAHTKSDGETEYIIHTIPMENYLIQSNIPDHTDGNSIVGTQGRKIGTGAIINDRNYTIGNKGNREGSKVSGKQLARIYGAAHAMKYMKSFKKFADKLKDTPRAISDIIYNILNNGRGNLASISRLTLLDGEHPTVPFAEPSNSGDINSSIISIFKKTVIRQLISGGSVVQASSMGYGKKVLTDTGLHAVIKDGIPVAMQSEMAFDFHFTDENGTMIPLRYEDYCDENGYFLDENGEPITEDKYDTVVPKIEIDFPGITDIIAYRIPTEMEYSMFHLKVVKCNPKSAANTIKLPAECTSIAGFDFDIDKLFLMRHNFKSNPISNEEVWQYVYSKDNFLWQALGDAWRQAGKPKGVEWHTYWDDVMSRYPSLDATYSSKEEVFAKAKAELQKEHIADNRIDYDMDVKDLTALSEGQLDNLIIDCMVAILSDESTLKDRYTIGGFAQASEDAKLMRLLFAGKWNSEEMSFSEFVKKAPKMEDAKINYDYSEPMTSVLFKEQNQIAGTLIGIFANDSVNNFISKGLKTFRIINPQNRILFGSLKDGVTEVDGKSEFNSSDIGLNFLHTSVNGVSIKRTLAELLAAAVDAVKDPVLNYLNLNSITADAAAMLARLGYTTRDIGLLFNQPVIKDMCTYMNRTGESNVRRALVAVLSGMGVNRPNDLFGAKASIDSRWFGSSELAINLSPNTTPSLESQIAVAQLFQSIMLTKQEFSNYIQQTRNTSANTVKSRFEDALSSEGKSNRKFDRLSIETKEGEYPITDDITLEDLLDETKSKELLERYKDHPFIYENVVFNIIKRAMNMMMDKYTLFNTPLYNSYRTVLSSLVAPWGIGADQMESLHYDLPTMLLSHLPGELNPNYIMSGQTANNALRYLLLDTAENKEDSSPETAGFIMQLNDVTNDPEMVNNPMIKMLIEGVQSVRGNSSLVQIVASYSSSLGMWEKFELTSGWDAIMKKYPEVGKGIFIYFYYQNSLNPKYNRVMELAPISVLKSIIVDEERGLSYVDFFRRDSDDFSFEGDKQQQKKDLYQFIISHNDDPKLVKEVTAEVADNSKELIFTVPRRGQAVPKNSAEAVRLQVRRRGTIVEGAYYAPVIKVNGMLYVMAKLDAGGYTIDYNNFKSNEERTIMYVPVSNDDVRVDVEDTTRRVVDFLNTRNGIIFNYSKAATQISKVISSEEIVTDEAESQSSSAEEAYDEAKDRTKNDPLTSSDGKEQCNIRR